MMAQVTEAVARGILSGQGYTDNEVRQLAHHWLSTRRQTGYIASKARYVAPVLFNPYTGEPRDARDIRSDPQGILIVPPGADLHAAHPQDKQPDVADSRTEAETMAEFENARYDEPRYRVVPLYAAPRPSPEQAALLAEIEGLRKKATRYDWLRDNWGYISDEYDDGGPVMSRIFLVGKDDGWDTDPESIDAAIDAALSTKEPG